MHLKVIYKIDLYAHNPINKNNTGFSKKVKERKGYAKKIFSGKDLSGFLMSNPDIKPFRCKISVIFNQISVIYRYKCDNILIPRAPPLV